MQGARIAKETRDLINKPVEGITAEPNPDNSRHIFATIRGPTETPFEGGIFRLEIFLPDEYPMVPPKVLCRTRIYHPNIDKLGRICLNILKTDVKDGWSPALQLRSVLLAISALIAAPNCDDPLDATIANHWMSDVDGAHKVARQWTLEHAQ